MTRPVLATLALTLWAGCASVNNDVPDSMGMIPDASVADAPSSSIDAPQVPDAAAPPDATPCTPIWQDLLLNGNFDSGAVDWTAVGGTIIRDNSPIAEHSGTFLAWFLGADNRDEKLSQTVAVPADAAGLRLRGSRCWTTLETTTTNAFDILNIELRTTGDVLLETLQNASNLDATTACSWSFFNLDAASAHAGQSIQVVLHATSDGASVTSFYMDTLELQALACP